MAAVFFSPAQPGEILQPLRGKKTHTTHGIGGTGGGLRDTEPPDSAGLAEVQGGGGEEGAGGRVARWPWLGWGECRQCLPSDVVDPGQGQPAQGGPSKGVGTHSLVEGGNALASKKGLLHLGPERPGT